MLAHLVSAAIRNQVKFYFECVGALFKQPSDVQEPQEKQGCVGEARLEKQTERGPRARGHAGAWPVQGRLGGPN